MSIGDDAIRCKVRRIAYGSKYYGVIVVSKMMLATWVSEAEARRSHATAEVVFLYVEK